MKGHVVDRRIRKTEAQLRSGLARLMHLKAVREITVKELVDEVDINRSTFYLHYTDIYDLIKKTEDELLFSIQRAIEQHPLHEKPKENAIACLEEVFRTLAENREICSALLGENGDLPFIRNVENIIVKSVMKNLTALLPASFDNAYLLAYCFSGCLGMVRCWATENRPESPDYMAQLTYRLIFDAMDIFLGKAAQNLEPASI